MATLYTDEDASSAGFIALLRAQHHAVHRAVDVQPGAADADQLAYAAQEGWIFVTHNGRHFCFLHDLWQRWSRVGLIPHAGILIAPQPRSAWLIQYGYDYANAAQAIDQLIAPSTLTNQIHYWHLLRGWDGCPPSTP